LPGSWHFNKNQKHVFWNNIGRSDFESKNPEIPEKSGRFSSMTEILKKNIYPVYFSQEISNNIMICLVKGKSFESMKCVRKLIILLINNK